MKLFIAIAITLCLLAAIATPATAHGEPRVRKTNIKIVQGDHFSEVQARGTYILDRRHRIVRATIFIIKRDIILEENSKRCTSCRRITVHASATCPQGGAVYAVVQGDVKGGGHFALWNSRRVVC